LVVPPLSSFGREIVSSFGREIVQSDPPVTVVLENPKSLRKHGRKKVNNEMKEFFQIFTFIIFLSRC
jgi:hypothetical protein